MRVVPERLKNIAEVQETIVYRTVAVERSEDELIEIKGKNSRAAKFARFVFSVRRARKNFSNALIIFSQGEITFAAIGETTARLVESKNFRVDFIAAKPTAKDFAFELIEFLQTGF